MARRWFLAAALLLPLCRVGLSQTQFFRVEDLRPGMKGIGKTCFEGSKPEEFQVEILGVMRGVSPGANAVLARFSGGPLAQTGIFEGMSGSPVFIDGKLLGAVAFSFAFPKEAIGGITPITQMVDAFTETNDAGATPRGALKKSMLWNYLLPANSDVLLQAEFERMAPQATVAGEARLERALAPFGGHALVPIATPLTLGGFSAQALQAFAPQFRALGLTVLQGAGTSPVQAGTPARLPPITDQSPVEPGSNIIVPLVRGDMDASAGGTVTYIDGKKLYAFGHLLFNLGFTELPMHKGRVITVFPSLQSSFKILETAEAIGTLRQDRSSGIYGVLGEKANMIPIHVRVTTARGVKKDLKYEIVRDRFLTPLMINLTVFNSIISSERALGVSTLNVKGKISIKGEEAVEIENRVSSNNNSPAIAALSIAVPVNFLLASGYKNLQLDNIDLDISSMEDDRAAVLDALRIDHAELKAGEVLGLDLFYKRADGELVQDSFPVRIPADLKPGPLSMLVADGTTMMAVDAREQGEDLIPRDLRQLIRFMNNIRKNDRLYVRIFRQEPGAVVRGEGLPGLPPSILSILKSDRNTGGMSPTNTSTFMEYELPPSDYVVSGSKIMHLKIQP